MSLSDKVSNMITVLLGGYLLWSVFVQHKTVQPNFKHASDDVGEIKNLTAVLNKTGQLVTVGWSKTAPTNFDPAMIYPVWFGLGFLRELRVKKWDYFSFHFGTKMVQIAVADVFYSSVSFATIIDYETGEIIKMKRKMLPFVDSARQPKLGFNLAGCPTETVVFEKDGYKVTISQRQNTTLSACSFDISAEADGRFSANLNTLQSTSEDQLWELVPVSENRKYFFHALKSMNNKCSGTYTLDNKTVTFATDKCVGIIDRSRSVLYYKTSWIWASAAGFLTDGRRVSINFGQGIGHEKDVNVFFAVKVDGDVFVANPGPIVYDPSNPMAGFTFQTADFYNGDAKSLEIQFKPTKEVHVSENLLLISSNLNYLYGSFSGKIVTDKGETIFVEGLRGLMEVGKFKW